MNNSRLSTNKNKSITHSGNLISELELLEKSEPLIKIDIEGRAYILSLSKYIKSTYIIEATLPDGLKNTIQRIFCVLKIILLVLILL